MPRNYIRTTTRQSWLEVNMEKAIKVVLDGSMGYLKAAKTHSVPQSTLEDRVKKARRGLLVEKASKKVYMGGFRTVFTPDQEQKLVDHISTMESRLFSFTMQELRTMAYDLAARNGIGTKFDAKKKMAGKDWLQGFLKRHKELSLRNREKTPVPRAMGFNRTAVEKFFETLGSLFEKYKFSPIDIYNVAETGITTVPNKPSKMIALRGRRQIGVLTSPNHEEVLVTTEICMSAAGIFMPTMFIFPCKKANPGLLADSLPGSTAEYHESGSMQKELFVKWFEQFIRFANPSSDKPVLLLVDGQASHTKSLELIHLASENNVILLSLPPHCTHKMQPLDVTFMAPLCAYYEQEVGKWLSAHPGCYVTIHQVGKLFANAFMTSAVMGAAINGFKQTGIYPFDPDIFADHMFTPTDDTTVGFVPRGDDFMGNFQDADGTPWYPDNSVESGTSELMVSSQPSTSRDSCQFGVQQQILGNGIHAQSKQQESEIDDVREENILICSPYKFELENALADLTQKQLRDSAKKRKLVDKCSVTSKELSKKHQDEYNTNESATTHGGSSSEEDKNL